MSITGSSPNFRMYPNPPASSMSGMPTRGLSGGILLIDQFQRRQTAPTITVSAAEKTQLISLHPRQYLAFKKLNNPEGLTESLYMYGKINAALTPPEQKQLETLLNTGVLHNTKTDDHHTALYHLYAMLTTPRANGYDSKALVRETVSILSEPFSITQKFAPLSKKATQQILQIRNQPNMALTGVTPPIRPLTAADLRVDSSATCVASSVMYYMADKEPAELARQLNELTSPLNAFFEKVRLDEISPDDPTQAPEILRQNRIPFSQSDPQELTVKVENPPAGRLRAVDSQHGASGNRQYRNGIETAYQSALTYLATHSYDPATDMRDSDTPDETSKGLTEAEKTRMETIVKNNGGVQSVTYQAVANKTNPKPGEEGNSYLYGYYRSFEQTTMDIINALKMGEPVVVGTTDTDETGAIVTGHEITITAAYVDPADKQLKFIVADSDDNTPGSVVKTARSLVPTIHHAGLPLRQGQKINQSIESTGGYLVPDQRDAMNFSLLHREHGPMPVEQPEEPAQPAYAPNGFYPGAYNTTLPGMRQSFYPGFTYPAVNPQANNPFRQSMAWNSTGWNTIPLSFAPVSVHQYTQSNNLANPFAITVGG